MLISKKLTPNTPVLVFNILLQKSTVVYVLEIEVKPKSTHMDLFLEFPVTLTLPLIVIRIPIIFKKGNMGVKCSLKTLNINLKKLLWFHIVKLAIKRWM